MKIPNIIKNLPLNDLLRVELSLEGSWSENIRTIWLPEQEIIYSNIDFSHKKYIPSLELYFSYGWVGFNCSNLIKDRYTFDNILAKEVLIYISKKIND